MSATLEPANLYFGVKRPANAPLPPEGNKHLHTFTALIGADIVVLSVSVSLTL